MRRVLLVACATAVGVMASAASAHATCYYSSAGSQSYADSPVDSELGLAPEITSVRAETDAACGVSVEPVIFNSYGGDLIDGEAVGTYVNTDGNPATGDPLWNGADRAIITVGLTGADLAPGIGVWNGSTFDFAGAPSLPRVGIGGWKANIDQLGIGSPVNMGIRTIAIYDGLYDVYGDVAPEVAASPFLFPVSFSTTAPAPPPPPPAPPASAQPQQLPSGPVRSPLSSEDESCTVPRVARLTAASAARKLRRAGCTYVVRREYSGVKAGRVIGTSPKAGKNTSRVVKLRVSRGRRARKRGRVVADRLTVVERQFSSLRRQQR